MVILVDLDLLTELSLSPNEYVYLYALGRNRQLTLLDDSALKSLESRGWLKLAEDGNTVLRHKSVEVLTSPGIKTNIESWIDDYRNIFPQSVKSGGYPVRGDKQGCIKKMIKFLKNYPEYSKDTILNATKAYVDSKKSENYTYMQLSHYFIEKDGISSLSSYCDYVLRPSVNDRAEDSSHVSNKTTLGGDSYSY
jgi:hypothetical protein